MFNVNVYSLSLEGSLKLSKNFKVKEFKCKDGSDLILVNPNLATVLQRIRDRVNAPVNLNSAYRSVSYNSSKAVNGSPKSQHCYGNAADITVLSKTPSEVAHIADEIVGTDGAVILYPTFVHVDVRGYKYRAITKDGKIFTSVSKF